MTKPRTCLLKLPAPALLPLLAFACATQPRPQPQPILSFTTPAAAATSFTTPSGRSISIEITNDFATDAPGSASLGAGDPDLFQGTDRRSAKLSLVSEPVEEFGSVADLIAALPLDTVMMNR